MNAIASTASAVPSRFIDNGDGTATDPKTGLVWHKATLGDGKRMTYDQALEAIAALGPEWRMPEFDELHILVDRTRFSPAIDTNVFPDTKHGAYWTSTPTAWASRAAWFVNFGDGDSGVCYRDLNVAFVRACRPLSSGQSL